MLFTTALSMVTCLLSSQVINALSVKAGFDWEQNARIPEHKTGADYITYDWVTRNFDNFGDHVRVELLRVDKDLHNNHALSVAAISLLAVTVVLLFLFKIYGNCMVKKAQQNDANIHNMVTRMRRQSSVPAEADLDAMAIP